MPEESYSPRQAVITHCQNKKYLFGWGTKHRKSVMCRHTLVPIILFHLDSVSLDSTSWWLYAWYIQTLREYPPTFESFFPPQGLSLSIPFTLTSDIGGSETEKNLRFLYSLQKYHLTFFKYLRFTLWREDQRHLPKDARGTDDTRVIMTSRQTVQGHPQFHPCHGSSGHKNDAIMSFTVHRQVIHSTWLGRELHKARHQG